MNPRRKNIFIPSRGYNFFENRIENNLNKYGIILIIRFYRTMKRSTIPGVFLDGRQILCYHKQ